MLNETVEWVAARIEIWGKGLSLSTRIIFLFLSHFCASCHFTSSVSFLSSSLVCFCFVPVHSYDNLSCSCLDLNTQSCNLKTDALATTPQRREKNVWNFLVSSLRIRHKILICMFHERSGKVLLCSVLTSAHVLLQLSGVLFMCSGITKKWLHLLSTW